MPTVSRKSLVIGGGGTKGVTMLGVLHELATRNLLNSVDRFYGTSVGSILALLLSVGWQPMELYEHMMETGSFVSVFTDERTILGSYGLAELSVIDQLVAPLVQEATELNDPTFRELYEHTDTELFIVGTNVSECSSELFSWRTRPEMRVFEAVEISCSLPLVLREKMFDGHEWTDGGLTNDYPIDLAYANSDRRDGADLIGVCADKSFAPPRQNKLLEKLWSIVSLPLTEIHRLRMSKVPHASASKCGAVTVKLVSNDYTKVASFAPTKEEKQVMFESGREMAATCLGSVKVYVSDRDEPVEEWDTWTDF